MNNIYDSERVSQESSTYDAMFETGGYSGVFDLPYNRSPYYPLYKCVFREITRLNAKDIFEVGCGTGGFAHLLLDKAAVSYRGFDFSGVAVAKAVKRTGRKELFFNGDAMLAEVYPEAYEVIVCTEVLEHVPEDRIVIENWKKGTAVICSVPNYDSRYHVRLFKNESEIFERYGDIIEIERIKRVKKPVIDDLILSNRLRQLRWNRYRPKRIAGLLGLGDFEQVGGWFVFTGVRK